MRILLSNKFYYRRGGDCIYMLNLEKMLQEHGNAIAIYAMQFPENEKSVWTQYFPSQVDFHFGKSIVEALYRPLGSREVFNSFSKLIEDFKPDVVHLNNIHSQISPIIGEIAHRKGVKVVWTVHDLKLLCPRYDCLRNGKQICTKCFDDKKNVLKYRCMKNSTLASVLSYLEAVKWNHCRLESFTDTFICPSMFMEGKMLEGGFNKSKLVHLSNSIDISKCLRSSYVKENYYCYIGRLSHEKGIKTLISAALLLNKNLIIIGDGPLRSELERQCNNADNIKFVGKKDWEDIKNLVGNARFVVAPSECYENNPLSVIESLCLGTPVLGANIGGIPELIERGINGMIFESGDVAGLKNKIEEMFSANFNYQQIAQSAQEKYDAEKYYDALMNIYKK
jgi:glycosyltransferase involved in cell wall biosynthesis